MASSPKDKTYYSLTKGFTFSSIIILLVPLTLLIMTAIWQAQGGATDPVPEWYSKGYGVVAIIAYTCAIIWAVLSVIMFITAGNLRGIKSPFGIRFGLLLAAVLVFSVEIANIVAIAMNIELPTWTGYLLPALSMLGYLIGACLGGSIKRALRA